MDNRYKLRNSKYQNVELKNSHWKRQRTDTIETYLAINNDDLLHIFRKKAGILSNARGLAGWYGGNACTFGQKIGALAKLYCVTGDYRLKEKALYLVEEWTKCVDKNPAVLENDSYVYEKLLCGLLDLYEYLGYKKGLNYVEKLTDYAISHFKRNIKRDGLQSEEIWENSMIEWYTLPENLYRAYLLTYNKKYKDFAEEWDYTYLWDKLNNCDFNIGPRHAYSQVNSLSSAARAYEVTGNEKYLSAMEIAYDEITKHHTFVTGGYGPAECLFVDREGYLGDSLKDTWDNTLGDPTYVNFGGKKVARSDTWGSSEISCCSWAVFKLCDYMIRFTGDAKYGEWVEKLLYNGTGGQLPVTPNGKVMYYANYFVNGAIKTVEDRRLQNNGSAFEWQCCTGTFPLDVAEYSNMLYYFDDDNIYVSQYLPSKVVWEKDGVEIVIENYSLYPEEEQIKFRVSADKNVEFGFKFRVPAWVKGKSKIYINGIELNIEIIPSTWAAINRVWSEGDIVTINFPFSLYFTHVDEKNRDIVALSYGPIVLAADSMSNFIGDVKEPEKWIYQVEGEYMTFKTKEGHVAGYDFVTTTFRPYYKIQAMQWYYMYNRIRPRDRHTV